MRRSAITSLPDNLTVGGDIVFEGCIDGNELIMVDGLPSLVISKKQQQDITILSCASTEIKNSVFTKNYRFYVVSKDGHRSYGDTIKEALADLTCKMAYRDVSQYKNMPMDTVKTPDEWAIIYRIVNGEGRYVTWQFMRNKKLKSQYTLSEIIDETKGACGHETFINVVGA